MSKPKYVTPDLTQKETGAGFVYLVFSFLALPSLLNMGGYLPGLFGRAGVNFLYYCINFLVLAFMLRRFLKESAAYVGRHLWPVLGYSVLGFFLYYSTNLTLSAGISQVFPGYSNQNDAAIAELLKGQYLLTALGTILLVPLAEELLHRALIFGSLYPKSPVFAYVFSMFIFAAVHVVGYVGTVAPTTLLISFLQYLPAGWILAWTYKKSGCIFTSVLIHTAINTLGVLQMR